MRLHIAGIPVHIKPSFWVLPLAYGLLVAREDRIADVRGPVVVGVAVGVVLAVLIHELGHAVAARRSGSEPAVTLHAVGGRTVFVASPSPWRNLWIASAGIVYQLVAVAVVFALQRVAELGTPDTPSLLLSVITGSFIVINLILAAINLLPVGGLDGGAMLSWLLRGLRVPHSQVVMFGVFLLAGGAVVVWAIANRDWIALAFAVYLTLASVRTQRVAVQYEDDHGAYPDAEPVARRLMAEGDFDELARWAGEIRTEARSESYATFGAKLEMYSLVRLGQIDEFASIYGQFESVLSQDWSADILTKAGLHDVVLSRFRAMAAAAGAHPAVVRSVVIAMIDAGEYDAALELASRRHRDQLPAVTLVSDVHARLCHVGAVGVADALRQAAMARRDVGYGLAAVMLHRQGLEDQALQRVQREADDTLGGGPYGWLAWLQAERGDPRLARESMSVALDRGIGDEILALQYLLDESGHLDLAVALGSGILAVDLSDSARWTFAFNHACGLAQLGRFQEAVDALGHVHRGLLAGTLLEDPDIDALRGYPPFVEMCAVDDAPPIGMLT